MFLLLTYFIPFLVFLLFFVFLCGHFIHPPAKMSLGNTVLLFFLMWAVYPPTGQIFTHPDSPQPGKSLYCWLWTDLFCIRSVYCFGVRLLDEGTLYLWCKETRSVSFFLSRVKKYTLKNNQIKTVLNNQIWRRYNFTDTVAQRFAWITFRKWSFFDEFA